MFSSLHMRLLSVWSKVRRCSRVFRAPAVRISAACRAKSYIVYLPRSLALPLLFSGMAILVVAASIATPPIAGLREIDGTAGILGTLLTAQAAIAALALAVTLFMMQGVSTRRHIDERIYREFVRRSWMPNILLGSILAVGVTGALLLSEGFIKANDGTNDATPEVRNLVLAAGSAFFVNLVLVGALFGRALHLSGPEQWHALRHDVNKRDVQAAVKAFLGRFQRAVNFRKTDEAEATILFPGPGEGSADEAIRDFLGNARRAMSERRQQEFRRSLDAIEELIKYAMHQISQASWQWSPPGGQPEWPPLRELSRNLYSFREEVIREGDRDYILELLRFDYHLITQGMREHCGELFTVGLSGYRWNYQIANRIGGEFREMLRDRLSSIADGLIWGREPSEAFPYIREIVRHQERLLYCAMQAKLPNDYEQLHMDFKSFLDTVQLNWEAGSWPRSAALRRFGDLEREYRIALMALAVRAVVLARLKRVADATPYLDIGRKVYTRLELMADDLASALAHDNCSRSLLWQEWEIEDEDSHQAIWISPEQYPLMFFALRLMELSSEPMSTFDLHGRAQEVLDWFIDNSGSIEPYVRVEIDPPLEQRRVLAGSSLRSAVRRDEVAEDYEIIGRELSPARVSSFRSDVYAAAFSMDFVERLFQRVGAFLYVSSDVDNGPRERGFCKLAPKGFFTDTPEGAHAAYAPLQGSGWGTPLSNDVLSRFCEALEESPEMEAPLDTPTALLQAIDQAIEDINTSEPVAILLVGDWVDLEVGLSTESPEGYEEHWRLPEDIQIGEMAQYKGHPIFRGPRQNSRRLYVLEPSTWGCFVRAQSQNDRDLRIEIKLISEDRARELLTENPNHFASQPDEESRLLKLQTSVEILVDARTGFRITDSSRARAIIPAD